MKDKILKSIKTEKDYEEFLEYLFTKQDLKYREFNAKIIVLNVDKLIGIRVPIVREIAKEIVKGEYPDYLKVFETRLNENKVLYFEEKLIYSVVICNMKEDFNNKLPKIDKIISLIDNWALCDCALSSARFIRKNQESFYKYLLKKIDSQNPWELRFVLVSLLEYYVEEKYLNDIFSICEHITDENYYVKMAKAWLLSICYINFKYETFNFLKNCNLDVWTVNKTVQKIRESLRVNKDEKENVLSLKR